MTSLTSRANRLGGIYAIPPSTYECGKALSSHHLTPSHAG